jgi:selenoprotein W-related protein
MAQEILTTFADETRAVTLQPSDVNGRYIISVNEKEIFDRKRHGGFAEIN